MSSGIVKPLHSLVIDAGPILKNDPPVSTLLARAEVLFTVPIVIEEIRDMAARSRVETTLLPFLKLRIPRPASVKVISDFARRTGDLEVLSKPDLQVLALAYEIECERNHGDWRLRSMPGQKRLNGAAPASLTGSPQVDPIVTVVKTETKDPLVVPEIRGPRGTIIPPRKEPELKEELIGSMASIDLAAGCTLAAEHLVPEPVAEVLDQSLAVEEILGPESEDSDSEGWITPSNIKKHQEKNLEGSVDPQEEVMTMQVATFTTDFAMQNVLLRMNLNLLSPSLQRIRQLRSWVLRCHACFDVTKDMGKQFCSRCGKPTLLRTSCSTDKDGNFRVHLKKNMQWNTRGDVYSIPKPVPGSANGKIGTGGGKGGWGQGLILAEDQKEYVRAVTSERRSKVKDLMDEDYLPSILSGDRGGSARGRPKVGAGKNVNSRRRNNR